MATDNLGPQFLFHGTAMNVEGDKILPAKVHGKGSYWGGTGSSRGEPSEDHAWAHPDEQKAWDFAQDRTNFHLIEDGETFLRRARVYAVHPNSQQSGGGDKSIPGEVKAPHFDIAHAVDTKPGHQGTFPGVNWNLHAKGQGTSLPGDEDANHPSPLSEQFGHHRGVWGDRETTVNRLHEDARNEDIDRSFARMREAGAVRPKRGDFEDNKEIPLPGMSDPRKFNPRMKPR